MDLKKVHHFNFVMACLHNHMKSTKFFQKDLYGYSQRLGGWSNIRIKKNKKKGKDASGSLDTDVGTRGLVLEEMENETPTCGFLGSESIIKSCDRGSYQQNTLFQRGWDDTSRVLH